MLAKIISGNSGWDVVFPSNNYIQPMAEMKLLSTLDHAWLPELANLDPQFESPPWDSGLRYSIPYMWGSTGIVFRKSIASNPRTWADLWNPALGGRLTMLDDPAEVLGACLKKLGYSLNSVHPAELLRAKEEAITQKRLVRAYVNAEVRDQLISGDVLCSQLWATVAQQAIRESSELDFCHPLEGFGMYADSAVVLRESRRPELAHHFINYLLRAEVSASVASATETATANRAARRLVRGSLTTSPVLYPPPDVLSRGEWFASLSAQGQRLRDRLWTEIKSA